MSGPLPGADHLSDAIAQLGQAQSGIASDAPYYVLHCLHLARERMAAAEREICERLGDYETVDGRVVRKAAAEDGQR